MSAVSCSRKLAFLALLAVGMAPAHASEPGTTAVDSEAVRLKGSLRAEYHRSNKHLDDDHDLFGIVAQAKLQWQLTDTIDAVAEARARDSDLRRGDSSEALLLEGYLTARRSRWDLRLGKQIVAWGRADGINPTDVLTPRDYTVPLPFDEDQRSGIWAAKVDYFFDEAFSLSAFASPRFKPSRIPLPTSAGSEYITEMPGSRRDQLGLRLDRAGGETDWSLSLFRGRSLFPEAYRAHTANGTSRIHLRYPRIAMAGADLARSLGRQGFRLEAAYFKPADDRVPAETGMKPYVHVIAGVDRTFGERFNVNLQLFGRRVMGGRLWDEVADPALRDLAGLNAFIFVQRDRWTPGMTARISNMWLHDTLAAEVFLIRYFRDGSRYVRPLLSYAINDAWKASVGADWYSGGAATYFGALHKNRNVFAELRYSF